MNPYERIMAGHDIETVLEDDSMLSKVSQTFNSIRNFSMGSGALKAAASTGGSPTNTPNPSSTSVGISTSDIAKMAQDTANKSLPKAPTGTGLKSPATSGMKPASEDFSKMTDRQLMDIAWTEVKHNVEAWDTSRPIRAVRADVMRELGRRVMARESSMPSFALSKASSLAKSMKPNAKMPTLKTQAEALIESFT